LKPILDKFLALILITTLLPIFLITYLYVYFAISKKVIFSQYRPGLDQKLFKLYKFKTMSDDTDHAGALLQDYLRLNTYGQFLRKSSLDELPELFNILLGQMSFIGPRPLLEEYLSLYSDEQQRRHSVKPGLTGLAQVNGRNKLSWDEKLRLDTEYAKNLSFSMDIIIFFKTIVQIFKYDEIDNNGKIMPKFKGSSEK
jgi:undecaprenyl phosphate N,N'-diacetylbacillosamine 1-phosphate transferase